MKLSFFPAVLALAALSSTDAACPCLYTDDDAEDCIVYGKIDDELVPWMRASPECLDLYNLRSSVPDPSLICASSNGFVDSLRSGLLASRTVKFDLGVSQMDGGFWEQDGGSTNILPVIKDSITINNVTTACTPQEVQVDCYTAMKPYFESDPDGQQEKVNVCETLENEARNGLELEQSSLRLRLCIEDEQGSNIRQQCNDLWAEVSQQIAENPGRDCTFVSVGSGTTTLPGCDEGDDNDDGGDSASQVGIVLVVSSSSLLLMLTNVLLW
jgi:hypothetical protein